MLETNVTEHFVQSAGTQLAWRLCRGRQVAMGVRRKRVAVPATTAPTRAKAAPTAGIEAVVAMATVTAPTRLSVADRRVRRAR